jgi:hypothetical protein
MEELVLFPAAALGALKAAHQKYRYAHRDQHGQNAFIRREPMRYVLHFQSPFPEPPGPLWRIKLLKIGVG